MARLGPAYQVERVCLTLLRLGAAGGAAQTARDLHASRLVVPDLARSLVVAGLRVVVRIEILPAAHAGDHPVRQAARLPLAARGADVSPTAAGRPRAQRY